MGLTQGSALNSSGFGAALSCGYLPRHTHLTYQGVFNELRYNVGPKTDKVMDLHHGYARFQFGESKFDSNINDYLALFLKGKADGEPRDPHRKLNSVLCLDISGSMNCGLGSKNSNRTRIDLCREAIKMFISKLQPEDSVGMTTFDSQAHLIFEPTLKKDISQGIYEEVDKIRACGGNTLIDGFNMSKDLLLKRMKEQQGGNYENRVIILSDVCDSSITHGLQQIKNAAAEHDIHLTIIGISTDFQSESCEALKETRGFNYFCATSDEDVLKYLFETFDYTFFPSASDISITLESEDVAAIEVFGTPDEIKSQPFEESTTTKGNEIKITRMESSFPSQIEIDKDTVYTIGGLMLVKIARKSKGPSFKGKIILTYKDIEGQNYKQVYDLDYNFHPEEQFLSD